jgi:PleD family two-component response regulator
MTRPVTSSFGVAELGSGETGESLLERVDAALYRAKDGGRNRVIAAV